MEPRRFAPKIPNDHITKQTPCLACLRGCPVLVCRAASISSSGSGNGSRAAMDNNFLFFVLFWPLEPEPFFALLCRAAQTLPPTRNDESELTTYFPSQSGRGGDKTRHVWSTGGTGEGVPTALGP